MRIISGKYKGKTLKGFDIDGTRPTMDRVKESLFAMIQNKVTGSICLDLFAGSGSLGIEALSNGAKKCYFVDTNLQIIKILKDNLNKMENFILLQEDALKALDKFVKQGIRFDIIFLDPPYSKHLISKVIQNIQQGHLLKENGIVVCEYTDEKIDCDLKVLKEKKYSDKMITIYINETIDNYQ